MKRPSSGELPKPPGYVPPPTARPDDVVRTLQTMFVNLLPRIVRLATARDLATSTTAEGLSRLRQHYERILASLEIDLHVHRSHAVPREGGLILFWNQESHLDHIVLPCAIPRPFVSLYNNAVARVPYYGSHMKRTGHLHVDRTNETQWRESVARAAARARDGVCVLVSPEGTRSWDGQLLPMKRGALMLATQSECDVVCITVIGGYERMPRGSAIVRKGPMHVVFSDPITTKNVSESELSEKVVETFTQTKSAYRF